MCLSSMIKTSYNIFQTPSYEKCMQRNKIPSLISQLGSPTMLHCSYNDKINQCFYTYHGSIITKTVREVLTLHYSDSSLYLYVICISVKCVPVFEVINSRN